MRIYNEGTSYQEVPWEMGKFSYGPECGHIHIQQFFENTKLYIGNYTAIGPNTAVYLGGNHITNWATAFPFKAYYMFNKANPLINYSNGDVVIGNDVWIAANTTIMSGVTIGDGAVIANNSHVVKDVEPYTVVGGNPAKVIRKRFSDNIIELLLKLRWWEFEDDQINDMLPILQKDPTEIEIKDLLNRYRSHEHHV